MSNEEREAKSEVEKIWEDDVLARRKDSDFLADFLRKRVEERRAANLPSSYVLNINAPWGAGKTFFLERFAQSLAANGSIVVAINAWHDDYAEDPLLSVMAGISRTLEKSDSKLKVKRLVRTLGALGGQVVAAGARGLVRQTAKRFIGEAVDEIGGMVGDATKQIGRQMEEGADELIDKEGRKLVDKFLGHQATIEEFKTNLRKLVTTLREEDKAPLFILIDELDRCKPSYAVALLERVKHLFDVDDVVFVIATDTDQLQHAVGVIYGDRFDSKRYLGRFFETTYYLETPSSANFLKSLAKGHPLRADIFLAPIKSIDDFLCGAMDAFGLSLREVAQTYDLIANIGTVWGHRAPIHSTVLIPLAAAHVLGMDVRLSNETIQQLESRGRGSSSWMITFLADQWERMPSETVSGGNVFRSFIKLMDVPLVQLFELQNTTGQPDKWVVQSLLVEARGVGLTRDQKSMIWSYPNIVRTVGHLSA